MNDDHQRVCTQVPWLAVTATQVIQRDMRGYIVAEDIGAVVNIMAAGSKHFDLWQQQQLERTATYRKPSQHTPMEQAALQQRQWMPQWMQAAEQQQQGLSDGGPGSKKGGVPLKAVVRRHLSSKEVGTR